MINRPNNIEKTQRIKNLEPDHKRSGCGCCGCIFIVVVFLLVYFFAPVSTKFLLMGIDRSPEQTQTGRSDTLQVFSVNPFLPTVKILSIPRDLWVSIPDYGENRINAAHFFAEAENPGSGPEKTLETIKVNFPLSINYFVRLNLNNFPQLIDSLGGITINLPEPMAGYSAGSHRLNGEQAMAFVRSRSDGDDFFRMNQGQFFIQSFAREFIDPMTWLKLPEILPSAIKAIDTNLPVWLWPRLGIALLRASITGVDSFIIDRNMVTPTVTSEDAQVLLPNWEAINELIREFN